MEERLDKLVTGVALWPWMGLRWLSRDTLAPASEWGSRGRAPLASMVPGPQLGLQRAWHRRSPSVLAAASKFTLLISNISVNFDMLFSMGKLTARTYGKRKPHTTERQPLSACAARIPFQHSRVLSSGSPGDRIPCSCGAPIAQRYGQPLAG